MKIAMMSMIILLFLSGCSREEEITGPSLRIGKSVVLLKGEVIMPLSDDAKVSITKNSEGDEVRVTLLSGKARVE